jgi:hypothetical protein
LIIIFQNWILTWRWLNRKSSGLKETCFQEYLKFNIKLLRKIIRKAFFNLEKISALILILAKWQKFKRMTITMSRMRKFKLRTSNDVAIYLVFKWLWSISLATTSLNKITRLVISQHRLQGTFVQLFYTFSLLERHSNRFRW